MCKASLAGTNGLNTSYICCLPSRVASTCFLKLKSGPLPNTGNFKSMLIKQATDLHFFVSIYGIEIPIKVFGPGQWYYSWIRRLLSLHFNKQRNFTLSILGIRTNLLQLNNRDSSQLLIFTIKNWSNKKNKIFIVVESSLRSTLDGLRLPICVNS